MWIWSWRRTRIESIFYLRKETHTFSCFYCSEIWAIWTQSRFCVFAFYLVSLSQTHRRIDLDVSGCLIEHVATLPTLALLNPTGVLVLRMKWPNSQMAVLIRTGGQGSVYEPSCPCILYPLLSPSPPNAWIMASLYAIIRQTCWL